MYRGSRLETRRVSLCVKNDWYSLIAFLEWVWYYKKKGGSDYADYKGAGSTQARDFRHCP